MSNGDGRRGWRRVRALHLPAACAVGALLLGVAVAAGAGAAPGSDATATARTFTLYGVAVKRQFINNTDDLARGLGKNPFGNYKGSFVNPPTDEKAFGPFGGDEGVFLLTLYADAGHKTKAGSATFICWYTFAHNAQCHASFALRGGVLVGKGAYDYDATKFRLAILGGISDYRSMRGVVKVTTLGVATQMPPVRSVAPMLQQQRLVFRIG